MCVLAVCDGITMHAALQRRFVSGARPSQLGRNTLADGARVQIPY